MDEHMARIAHCRRNRNPGAYERAHNLAVTFTVFRYSQTAVLTSEIANRPRPVQGRQHRLPYIGDLIEDFLITGGRESEPEDDIRNTKFLQSLNVVDHLLNRAAQWHSLRRAG